MNLFSLWQSDKMVLRMYGAEEVDARIRRRILPHRSRSGGAGRAADAPRLRDATTRNPTPSPPAAIRQNAAVCASTGLLEMLSPEEVAGVMAHELAHVKNYDTLTMAVAATIGGAVSMLAQYLQFGAMFGGHRENNNGVGWIGALVAMIVAPLAAMLVQMAISRSREYQADRLGAMICGQPLSLASALRKIEGLRPSDPQRAGRGGTCNRAPVHHQSADRRGHGQSVLDPSQHRQPHCRVGEAGAGNGDRDRASCGLPLQVVRGPDHHEVGAVHGVDASAASGQFEKSGAA